jgi:hypothetical protein
VDTAGLTKIRPNKKVLLAGSTEKKREKKLTQLQETVRTAMISIKIIILGQIMLQTLIDFIL